MARRGRFDSPFKDAVRITPETYVSLSSLFLMAHLPGTTSLVDLRGKLVEMFSGYKATLSDATLRTDRVAVFIKMSTLGISVHHRALMSVLAPFFSLKWDEVRLPVSRNARVFDVCGARSSVLSFIPVFQYCVAVYDTLTREQIIKMKCIRLDKHLWRKKYTEDFCQLLSEVASKCLK